MKLMLRPSRFSIRFLLTVVLGVAIAFGVLRVPESRSARFLGYVRSGEIDDALVMITSQRSEWFLAHFENLLREENVTVSSDSLDMTQYLSCERTVYVGGDMITFEFAVGLTSVECTSIIEPLVSRGEI